MLVPETTEEIASVIVHRATCPEMTALEMRYRNEKKMQKLGG
jgi:hypothetical protein